MNYKKTYDKLVRWLQEWFEDKPATSKLIVGISGGLDSTLTVDIAVKALGSDRVYGVLMPNGNQHDIEDSLSVVEAYQIPYTVINIKDVVDQEVSHIKSALNKEELSKNTIGNIEARIRMTTLYAVGSEPETSGFVSNNCNLSEDYIGYSTKYGDAAGDVGLLRHIIKTDIFELSKLSKVMPENIIEKPPIDGLTTNSEGESKFKTDEESMGFTYSQLDKYIKGNKEGIADDIIAKIERLHKISEHKRNFIPAPKV